MPRLDLAPGGPRTDKVEFVLPNSISRRQDKSAWQCYQMRKHDLCLQLGQQAKGARANHE